MQEAQPALEKRSIATSDEAEEGAGRMPVPQAREARRPRYSRRIGLTFVSRTRVSLRVEMLPLVRYSVWLPG